MNPLTKPQTISGLTIDRHHPLAQGLRAYYPFIVKGHLHDMYHPGRVATNTGSDWITTHKGTSIQCVKANSDYIEIPDPRFVGAPMTLSCILRSDSNFNVSGSIIDRRSISNGSNNWMIVPDSTPVSDVNDVVFYVRVGAAWSEVETTNNNTFANKAWVHLTVVDTGAALNLYVNGALLSGPIAAVGTRTTAANQHIWIARRRQAVYQGNDLTVALFAMWDRVLGASEVKDLAIRPYDIIRSM